MKKSFVTPILGVGFLLSSGVFAADYASPVTQPSANTTLSQSGASHVDNPLSAHVGGAPVAGEDTELPFEEVFTSKHWLVRVFRVAHAR